VGLGAKKTNREDMADPPVLGSEAVGALAIVTPVAAAPVQALRHLVQPSDWVRWLVPTMPAAAVPSSNAGVPPMHTPIAVPVEALRIVEPTGMAPWGATSEREAVGQVFADAAF